MFSKNEKNKKAFFSSSYFMNNKNRCLNMAMSKRDLEKRQKDHKKELADLEVKCKGGSGTKEDYVALAKLRKKL